MNCILLPAVNFSLTHALIDAPRQIEHLNKVLSAQVGDTLKIGQLGGNLGTAVVHEMTPTKIQLCNVQLTLAPPPKLDVTVVLALPRPKVLRRLIMDMTALGVRDIVLINSYRTQKSYWQSPLLARLDEFVLEGLQQGVDTLVPRITLQKRFKPFVEDELASLMTNRAIVAHPYSELSLGQYLQQPSSIQSTFPSQDKSQTQLPKPLPLSGMSQNKQPIADKLPNASNTSHISSNNISNDYVSYKASFIKSNLPSVVCIGAEGGWIDYEIELLAAQGCQAVNMGRRVLRTEAAVNALLGQWLL